MNNPKEITKLELDQIAHAWRQPNLASFVAACGGRLITMEDVVALAKQAFKEPKQ